MENERIGELNHYTENSRAFFTTIYLKLTCKHGKSDGRTEGQIERHAPQKKRLFTPINDHPVFERSLSILV